TPGPSILTFDITSFESKLREAWLNSTSCRRITSSRTYSPKHYHDNGLNSYFASWYEEYVFDNTETSSGRRKGVIIDTMADMTAPTGQAPTIAPPVRTNDQILPRIIWVRTGYLKFSAKGTKREVFGMPIPDSLITA
nr:hypothetical protein [Tanacetum cinerariifolium]